MTLQSNSPELIFPLGSRVRRGIEAWRDSFTGILYIQFRLRAVSILLEKPRWMKREQTEVREKPRLCLGPSADFTTTSFALSLKQKKTPDYNER